MRPHIVQRPIKSRSVISIFAAACAAIIFAVAGIVLAPQAIACFSIPPDKSVEVKFPLGAGVEAAVQISFFEKNDPKDLNAKGTCSANAYLPLSAFPSTSNRYGINEIASAIREQVDAWELSECYVTLYFENDTNVDLAEHELCTQGTFAFEEGSFWSSESESYCWEPIDSESLQGAIADADAETDLETEQKNDWDVEPELAQIDEVTLEFK